MQKKILGDFQTPLPLARAVLRLLERHGMTWGRALEPTCGIGNFIQAVRESSEQPSQIIGIELQLSYANEVSQRFNSDPQITILQHDIFSIDLESQIQWQNDLPLLIVGNPPWVTNAAMAALGGENLPQKSNFKNMRGIDAITGHANFDVAEFIVLKLLKDLRHTPAVLAVLCKSSVARNVISTAQKERFKVRQIGMHRIDSMDWFGAAVDACLLTMLINQGDPDYETRLYPDLEATVPESVLSFQQGTVIADKQKYAEVQHLEMLHHAGQAWTWRAGVKHDASSVFELRHINGSYVNGDNIVVDVEDDYLFPLLKSSDIKKFNGRQIDRAIIITQKAVGESTRHLETYAPHLWRYLQQHEEVFLNRKSSIYLNKPKFSIFGVGDYTFAPYKVIVSGFYKEPRFIPVGAMNGKPIICDDTCYLLPQTNAYHASVVAAALNSTEARTFLASISFADSKRPYTKSVLSRLDVQSLIRSLPSEVLLLDVNTLLSSYFPEVSPIDSVATFASLCERLLESEAEQLPGQMLMF